MTKGRERGGEGGHGDPGGPCGQPGKAKEATGGEKALSGDISKDARQEAQQAKSGSAYRVLARKYRPRRFEDLVGQEAMVRTLTNAFETGRIAQGYMLTGVRGIGKTTTARLIARALNYSLSERPTVKMEEMGEHCAAILESRHVDVIEMDAASHTSVDNIREIIDQVPYRPVAARYKVYIIDEVHMLSKAAFNALLKTLEEPPEHVKFIFATTEIRKVPVTVLSRCQRFDLRRVEAGRLMEHLADICRREEATAEGDALRMIARAAEGSVRDALSLLDQALAYGQGAVRAEDVSTMLGLVDKGRIMDLFEALMAGRVEEALRALGEQHALGAEPAGVLADLAAFTHLVTRMRVLGEKGADAAHAEEERRRGLKMAGRLSMPHLSRAWQMLLKGMAEVQVAPQPLAAAEMVLIRLAHAAAGPTPRELVQRLSEAGAGAGGTGAGGKAGSPGAPRAQARAQEGPVRQGAQGGQGPGPAQQAKAATATARQEMPRAAQAPMPESLAQIVALAGEHRDLKMMDALERFVRPVRISPGRLEIALEEGAPRQLPGELAQRLEGWTGQRWTVIISDEPGEETIRAKKARERDSLFARAQDHPLTQEVLRRFPEARITDVRPHAGAPVPDGPSSPITSEDER